MHRLWKKEISTEAGDIHQPKAKMDEGSIHQMWKGRPFENSIKKPRKETQISPKCKTSRRMEATRLNEKQAINLLLVFQAI